MKKVVILPSFERSVKKLASEERRRLAESLEQFNLFLLYGRAPFGFRFKKINHDKYEFRIDIRLRVIIKEEDDVYYLVLVGSHDQVRKYLRHFRK